MTRISTILVSTVFLGALVGGCAEQPDNAAQNGMATDTMGMAQDTAAMGQTGAAAVVGVYEAEPYGQYLVDGDDMSLYLFKADSAQNASTCYDACAQAWPPLLTDGEPQAGDPAVQADLLGTVERDDGTIQVTYNDWPLYYYAEDTAPGDAQGQDVMGFGAEWYLVSPSGMEVEAEGETTGP